LGLADPDHIPMPQQNRLVDSEVIDIRPIGTVLIDRPIPIRPCLDMHMQAGTLVVLDLNVAAGISADLGAITYWIPRSGTRSLDDHEVWCI
jgi:hypothetical protein